MNSDINIEIKDLDEAVGTDLSSEELQSVSGGRQMIVTWVCGAHAKPDEWMYP
jgi:hypothetical protein